MITAFISLGLFSIVPLIGILFFGWDWREVLLLYWLENISVGIVALINIFKAPIGAKRSETGVIIDDPKAKGVENVASRVFMALFFCIHYGLFTLVHGVFVLLIVGGVFGIGGPLNEGLQWAHLIVSWLIIAAIQVLMALTRPAQANDSVNHSFLAPYKRIIALHLSIILGIFIIGLLGLPAAAAILLIGLHLVIDFVSMIKPKWAPKIEGA